MSSLYNRWVPPKKSKAPVQPPKSPEPHSGAVAAIPPSTLYASTPYARYVPLKKTTPRAIARQSSPPSTIKTQSDDEEPEDSKPKKRRRIEKTSEEQQKTPKRDKKDKKRRKNPDCGTHVSDSTPIQQSENVETGIAALDLDKPVSAPQIEAEMETEQEGDTEDAMGEEDEGMKEAELENDAAEAILAKYRTAMRKSVQVETAIKAKKAKEGVRTPTPEPELHGRSPNSLLSMEASWISKLNTRGLGLPKPFCTRLTLKSTSQERNSDFDISIDDFLAF